MKRSNKAPPVKKAAKKRASRKRGIAKNTVISNHIPIDFSAPTYAVEGTMFGVLITFDTVNDEKSALITRVQGKWKGSSGYVAGPIDVVVSPNDINGDDYVTAPMLGTAPQKVLVLEATYDDGAPLTFDVTIVKPPSKQPARTKRTKVVRATASRALKKRPSKAPAKKKKKKRTK